MNTHLKEWLTRKEAAAHLAGMGYPITPKTLARLANRRGGPPFKQTLHRLTSYNRVEIERWAAANTIERLPTAAPTAKAGPSKGALNSFGAKGA